MMRVQESLHREGCVAQCAGGPRRITKRIRRPTGSATWIESFFGAWKGLCNSNPPEHQDEMAFRAVWGRLLLWNIAMV